MPCFFQARRCAASDELATSTAWTLLAYSWPMRWNTRSAPVRSARTSMPNFALNAAPTFSETDRSIEVYQTTLPSFFAASINCGVMASAGGACATTREANKVPSASALEPFRMSRLLILFFIAISSCLSAQRAATLRRQCEPDLAALGNGIVGLRDDPQRGAVRCFDHVIAAAAEKNLTRHGSLDHVLRSLRG